MYGLQDRTPDTTPFKLLVLLKFLDFSHYVSLCKAGFFNVYLFIMAPSNNIKIILSLWMMRLTIDLYVIFLFLLLIFNVIFFFNCC